MRALLSAFEETIGEIIVLILLFFPQRRATNDGGQTTNDNDGADDVHHDREVMIPLSLMLLLALVGRRRDGFSRAARCGRH